MLPSPHVHCLCARSHGSHWHYLHSLCLRPLPGPHWWRQVLELRRRSRQQCVAISGCVCSGRGSARVHHINSNASDSDGRVRSLRAHALLFLRTVCTCSHMRAASVRVCLVVYMYRVCIVYVGRPDIRVVAHTVQYLSLLPLPGPFPVISA